MTIFSPWNGIGRGHAKIHLPARTENAEPAVLRLAFLCHVDLSQGLQRGDHAAAIVEIVSHALVHQPIEAEPHSIVIGRGFDVHVTGAFQQSFFEHLRSMIQSTVNVPVVLGLDRFSFRIQKLKAPSGLPLLGKVGSRIRRLIPSTVSSPATLLAASDSSRFAPSGLSTLHDVTDPRARGIDPRLRFPVATRPPWSKAAVGPPLEKVMRWTHCRLRIQIPPITRIPNKTKVEVPAMLIPRRGDHCRRACRERPPSRVRSTPSGWAGEPARRRGVHYRLRGRASRDGKRTFPTAPEKPPFEAPVAAKWNEAEARRFCRFGQTRVDIDVFRIGTSFRH